MRFLFLVLAINASAQCDHNPMLGLEHLTKPIVNYALAPTSIKIVDCDVVKVFWWDASKMVYCHTDSNGVGVFEVVGYNTWIKPNGNPCELETVVGYGDLTPNTTHCFQAWTSNVNRPSNLTSGANILMATTPPQGQVIIGLGEFEVEVVDGIKKIRRQ